MKKFCFAFVLLALVSLACSASAMPGRADPESGVLPVGTPFLGVVGDFGAVELGDEREDAGTDAGTRTVCVDALNVRRGPGVQWAVVGWLTRGASVQVLEERGGWARFESGDPNQMGGWVKAVYLCP